MQTPDFVAHNLTDAAAWAGAHFGGLTLGHRHRNARAERIARAFAMHPGRSIPRLFDRPYDIKASYTFFDDPRSTPDALQQTHRALVRRQAAECALTLAIEDTTEVSYSHRPRIDGLGSIGNGDPGAQGFWLHSVLEVGCPEGRVLGQDGHPLPVRVLGLADQQYGVRPWPTKVKGQPTHRSAARRGQPRETQMWERSLERMGPAGPTQRRVRIAERGADLYEYLAGCQAVGDGFVVRARFNRVLIDGRAPGYLLDRARSLPSCGHDTIELRARAGRAAREARVSVSCGRVTIRAPQRPGAAAGARAPIACSVVRVWEEAPPEGVEALEWVLLSEEPIDDVERAREIAARYAKRWLIEEYHKALKTGLGAEESQMETAERLLALVAVLSVVALRLIELREQTRIAADAPVEASGLDALELRVLSARLKRTLTTVRDVALAIGRLGGHMNRAGDGMPGWITLWRGMQELATLVEGVRLAQALDNLG